MALLDHAADWFKARDTRIRSWHEDDQGRYAFVVVVDGQSFIVTAKKYLQDGQASFMGRKVVQRAIDTSAYILLFTEGDRRLVFDPKTVDEAGTHGATQEDSRKARGEAWVDVDADLSVRFDAWARRGKRPPSPDDVQTKPTSISGWADQAGDADG